MLAGKESVEGGEGEETCCGLVVYVPKSYRVPTFLGWKLSDSKTLVVHQMLAYVNFAEKYPLPAKAILNPSFH